MHGQLWVRGRLGAAVAGVVSLAATVAVGSASADDAVPPERVSVATGGVPGAGDSHSPSISADGRYVAFDSYAANLVPGDTNGHWDVFVRDRVTGETRRVSVASDGTQGDGLSTGAAISADGRFVAFSSRSTTLDAGEAGGAFVHELATGRTERVSLSSRGKPGSGFSPSLSADGRYAAFASAEPLVARDTNGIYDVDIFVRDRVKQTTRRVSVSSRERQSNGFSDHPAISADGRFVAFESYASNLVPGDTGTWDVFVRNLVRGTTEKISVNRWGRLSKGASRGPSISANGRYVAFTSGSVDMFKGDRNKTTDIFLRDRKSDTTRRVSRGVRGGNSNNWSRAAAISANGRFVTFSSGASNVVRGDTNDASDVFVWSRASGSNRRVSIGAGGVQGDDRSEGSVLSRTGRFVAFDSQASTLAPPEGHPGWDVFLHDLG